MEKPRDFSRKMIIALREDLASWQLTNTVGHIAAYLGNKMPNDFDTGESFRSEDGKAYPRNSQYPIVAVKASAGELKDLTTKLQDGSLLWIAYVQEMIDMSDDKELAQALEKKHSGAMDMLGVGIFGTKEELKELTGKLKLWK